MLDTLSTSSLFSSVQADHREKIASKAILHTYPKGKVLFLHEEKADYFYIIKSGWVKLFRETLDGDQAIIDILTDTHTLGETSIFNDDFYPYSAEVVETAEILQIPLSLLKNEIETNGQFAASMMKAMARYRRQQEKEIEHLTLQNASQRIGCFLLRLTDQKNNGPTKIHLPYDKMLVASRLGMKPETFSRALVKLKQETNVQINGATVEVNSLDDLIGYSCSACSSEFPCKDK